VSRETEPTGGPGSERERGRGRNRGCADTIELVTTDRLICERLRHDHAEELSILLLDPRVRRTLWRQPHRAPSESEIADRLAATADHWQRHGFGMWLLRDRHSGEMVGRGGLQHTSLTGADEVEVGWALTPERWGRGLATELALASVQVGLQRIGLAHLIAFTLPHNTASRRLMEKAAFRFERNFEHAGLLHVLYRRSGAATAQRQW
jgi:[ribosomal protein S5]-alanine N-acetyltransferase